MGEVSEVLERPAVHLPIVFGKYFVRKSGASMSWHGAEEVFLQNAFHCCLMQRTWLFWIVFPCCDCSYVFSMFIN